jgi:programmed cell death 8 (apoptosis-inducing factor)
MICVRTGFGPSIQCEAVGLVDARLPTISVWSKPAKHDAPMETLTVSENLQQKEILQQPHDQSPPSITSQRDSSLATSSDFSGPIMQDFQKGIIFYLRDQCVVGVLMFNLPGKISIARQLIQDAYKIEENLSQLMHHFQFPPAGI